jgi:hypothetical protein
MITWLQVENTLLNAAEIVQITPAAFSGRTKAKILYLSDGRSLNVSEEDWAKIQVVIGAPKEF